MKTQIIKIIPCLLAGFILSACVGAVNVPSDVAEKKTGSEPIVLDPETILINRCIMDDNAKALSCASIVEDNPCITDPFDVACDITFANFYKTAQANRISFCRDNYDSDFCQSAGDDIKNICLADPFDKLCFIVSASSYNNARETTCAEETDSMRCETTISRVCSSDSLDALCFGNETYYPAQKTACARELNSDRCAPIIARACDADVLDTLCNGLATYFTMQETACERDDKNRAKCASTITRVCDADSLDRLCDGEAAYYPAQKTACESTPDSSQCAPIIASLITWICDADSLDALCAGNKTYFPAQEIACTSEPNSDRCAPIVARTCEANVLNGLCNGKATYFTMQKTACEREPNSASCAPIIVGLCVEIPFDALCQSVNLTLRDLPALPNDNFRITNYSSPSGRCSNFSNCFVRIPEVIDIKPLNNTNTGMATYTGLIALSYLSGVDWNINESIDIIANFDNNTLSYSGNLGTFSYPFSINGNFTDRGLITGKAILRSREVSLIGLIGQNKAIGVFADEGRSRMGSFAGGFTATRQTE